ncbi:MAG TPA: dephospho-CoA kinase [Verrucomicrobiae bacterium]|jgi:dephospho-CoA kinase
MKLLGLTGGIGAGKSTAAEFLQRRGLPVIDTDAIAHQLTGPGQPALSEIFSAFGSAVRDEYGRLRREELARIVFTDSQARERLEAILHPRIREVWLAQANQWLLAGEKLGVVVIPLLFETKAATFFYATICAACTAATQRRRLLARGWSEAHITDRLRSQWPLDKKMDAADLVIWTEAGVDVHEAQLTRILASL